MIPLLLLVLFVLLQILDWLLTRRLLTAGVAYEANPVTAFLIRHAGINAGILAPKALATVLVAAFLFEYPWALGGLCVVYIGIVVWNYVLVRSKLD
jgi:hypothetical protein